MYLYLKIILLSSLGNSSPTAFTVIQDIPIVKVQETLQWFDENEIIYLKQIN